MLNMMFECKNMHEHKKTRCKTTLDTITYDEIQECYARLRKANIDECLGWTRYESNQKTKKQIKT